MNIFKDTYHVSIELSNLCNYAYKHKNCPASKETEKIILPSKIVYDVLDTLGRNNYGKNKSIAFYLYSDSMNDPRLFSFLNYAKKVCPEATIIIGTNGWYLDETMTLELYEAGATFILVTSYNPDENTRLNKVRANVCKTIDEKYLNKVSFSIRRSYKLDNRLNMKGRDSSPCYSPITEFLIMPNGQMRFCCLDIAKTEAFGDLYKQSFEDVIKSNYDRLKIIRDDLINAKRTLDLCKKCSVINRMKGLCTKRGDFRHLGSRVNRAVK